MPRHAGIVLTAGERANLRVMIARSSRCETRYLEIRRAQPRPDGIVEQRAVMPAPCHVRICPTCDQRRRDREAVRLEGRWRTFWTMGLPAGVFSAGRAWRKVSAWVGRFFQAVRRAVRESDPAADVRIARSERRAIEAENAGRAAGRRAPTLQYGWCIEPHKSGYPHVHFVTNAYRISAAWVRTTWSRIIRARVQWNFVRRVKTIDGVCRYLAKYQSKTVFTLEVSAILYRRRTWASTVKAAPVEPRGWEVVPPEDGATLSAQVDDPRAWARAKGWEVTGTGDGSYATFARRFTLEEWARYEASRDRSLGETAVQMESVDREFQYFEEHRTIRRAAREEGGYRQGPSWPFPGSAAASSAADRAHAEPAVSRAWASDGELARLGPFLF